MNPYSQAALAAVEAYPKNPQSRDCLERSDPSFLQTIEGEKDICPRTNYLGLFETGLAAHIPAGNFTLSKLNEAYALKAAALLETRPKLDEKARTLPT